ncbi:hydrolase [Thalassomonas viridans]|uniref:Hydrolase n=1 Tax=Thalassomonas viridans TaxID=137584 RepID=A0AAF0C7S7_9GAMM|nr:hydrolase [Thalassomonas viridans]WDE05637.1 hydrolase [Thalassomonas viridans]
MFYQSQFKAAWWLANPHLQTIAAKYLRRKTPLATVTETLELPDGDFIDLAWTEIPAAGNTRPLVVILHGLEGSVNSHYAQGMLRAVKALGWIGVVMHFRGCSGRPNRQERSYHSGDTRDISYLTGLLKQRYPDSPLCAIGFSLGGNVLTRYLACTPGNPYKAAVVICAPLHLSSCSDRINRGFSKVYQQYLVKMMKESTYKKIARQQLTRLDRRQLAKVVTIRDFDDKITAPVNGFVDAEDYYRQMSGRDLLAEIRQPCLVIHAMDDPFLSHRHITGRLKLSPTTTFELCRRGGHVGFISGRNPFRPKFYLEHRVPAYLKEHLQP